MSLQSYYQELYRSLPLPKDELSKLKLQLCRKHDVKVVPTDIELFLNAPASLKKFLQSKPMRTRSGVSPIAIMTAPARCPHGRCTFCPGGIGSPWGDVPQSYTGHEPATMRAIRNEYDSYLQVFNRLEQFTVLGHVCAKAEVIVMGGTFPAMPKEYQDTFVKFAFKAMNDFSAHFFETGVFDEETFKTFFELPGDIKDTVRAERINSRLKGLRGVTSLEAEHARNEHAAIRCVGLTIETKPDWAKLEHADQMLRLGCTRVELGIESVYDDVLKHTNRGHDMEDTLEAMRTLKDLGFKINAHYMPGLPLTDHARDIAGMRQLFNDPDLRPDMLKLYPCMVSPGTALEREFKEGRFTPLSTDDAASLIAEFKPFVPEYCRIMRVQRDVPTKYWTAGVGITNLRQRISEINKPVCRCIRCREPNGRAPDWSKAAIKVMEYEASGGCEFFIAMEDPSQDMLLGFCRLRFPSQCLRSEITPTTALIRELHVYGEAVSLHGQGTIQHRGIGQRLLQEAESIARKHQKDKVIVISGVGVRGYYYKHGYARDGPYVSKVLG